MLAPYLVAGVIGVMLFFSVAVAPTIFTVLPQEWASAYVRKFFPKYYAVLGACCLIAALLSADPALRWMSGVTAVLFALSLWVLTPAINAASDRRQKRRFGLLHGASVAINLLQLVLLVYALWVLPPLLH